MTFEEWIAEFAKNTNVKFTNVLTSGNTKAFNANGSPIVVDGPIVGDSLIKFTDEDIVDIIKSYSVMTDIARKLYEERIRSGFQPSPIQFE